jgi:hypothetical protein
MAAEVGSVNDRKGTFGLFVSAREAAGRIAGGAGFGG